MMKVSLPENLKAFVDQRVGGGGFGTSSQYVRDLTRRDQDRQQLRGLLLEGAASAPTAAVDTACLEALRKRATR